MEPIEVSKEPDLVEDWNTSEYLFQLERRAIFGKAWHCLAHVSRLPKAGSYVTLPATSALPPLFLIRDRSLIPRAFHNVCRHRAYNVTRKASGTTLVLGCKYHGWSYDTRGKLVKAPHFDELQGFRKEDNGLWEVRCATDRQGWIWGCVDARGEGIRELGLPEADIMMGENVSWLKGWDFEGKFNWKCAAPEDVKVELPARTGLFSMVHAWLYPSYVTYSPPIQLGISSFLQNVPETPLWLHCSIFPNSATASAVHFDLYTSEEAQNPKYNQAQFLDQVGQKLEAVIREIEAKHASIAAGTSDGYRAAPKPTYLQHLKAHLRDEQVAGGEILPWSRGETRSEACSRAEKVCQELDAMAQTREGGKAAGLGGLDW